jgi:DNA-binding transcriptional LysR family regulator
MTIHAWICMDHDCWVMVERMDILSRRGVSLDRLQSFLAVADAGGMARAAPGDPVRQSQLSRQVKELETALARELFQRRGRTLVLTGAGKALQGVVRELGTGLRDVASTEGPQHVSLAAGDSALQWLILPRLRKLRGALEGLVLSVGASSADETVDALKGHAVDLGVLRARDASGDLTIARVGSVTYEVFHAVGRKGLPLAVPSTERGLDRALAALGKPALRCESFPQVAQAVRSGAFAGVLPSFARAVLPEEDYRATAHPALEAAATPLAVAWRPRHLERRPAVAVLKVRLVEILRAALR